LFDNVEYQRQWYENNKDEVKRRASLSYLKHRDKAIERSKKKYASDPEKHKADGKARRRLKKCGWTPEAVEKALISQENKCAICKKEFTTGTTGSPNADHKHCEPPIPRKLLCRDCNLGLGNFKDNPQFLREAANYVEEFAG